MALSMGDAEKSGTHFRTCLAAAAPRMRGSRSMNLDRSLAWTMGAHFAMPEWLLGGKLYFPQSSQPSRVSWSHGKDAPCCTKTRFGDATKTS